MLEFLSSKALARNATWIVIDRFDFTGIVTAAAFASLPARLCFLALTLELEDIALRLCKLFPDEAFKVLPAKRIESAIKTMTHKLSQRLIDPHQAFVRSVRRTRKEDAWLSSLVIDATSLIDKATILRKLRLTIDVEHKEIERIFNRAERLRNSCAHPTDDAATLPFTVEELTDLASQIARMTRSLTETYRREMRDRANGAVPTEPT